MESTTPQQFQERAREVQARIAPQIDEARKNLTDLNTRVVGFIRERPALCLIGAVGFGFLVGKMASRR